MDANLRTSVIAAAVTSVGPMSAFDTVVRDAAGQIVRTLPNPGAWQAAVEQQALTIAIMGGDKHRIGSMLDKSETFAVFPGTVMSVVKETRSTRGFVTLYTGTPQDAKDMQGNPLPQGYETLRTDRTDNPTGQAMAKKIRDLAGHRILLWIEHETMGNQTGANARKVRVVRYVEDLGVDREAEARMAAIGLGVQAQAAPGAAA